MFTNIAETEKKASQMVTPLLFGIMLAAIVSYIVIFATPLIAELPVQVTEDAKVIGITEKGIIIETSSGVAVVTDQYKGLPGDIIKVTYSVPQKYLKEKRTLEAKYDAFHPGP